MSDTPPTGGLRSRNLQSHYRSDVNDVVQDFFVPALSAATEYRRAVGYFSSTSLALVSRGLSRFIDNGGRIQLLASPQLELDDLVDLERGYEARDVLERAAMRALESDQDAELDGLGVLGRMIATGHLDIKLAFVEQAGLYGIYHEKIGYFRDARGEVVAFTGSSNETYGGMVANFESVEVYSGWLPGDHDRAQRIVNNFDALWTDRTARLQVMPFPEVARERLLAIARERPRADLPGMDDAFALASPRRRRQQLIAPAALAPRDYQLAAIKSWLSNRGRGMLKMATGTGKTKTALFAAGAVARAHRQREQPLVVLITAPYQHLVDQWVDEVTSFGISPIAIYESSERWTPIVEEQLAAARLGQQDIIVLVATNTSFALPRFQEHLHRIDLPLLFVADEAHTLGSRSMIKRLPEQASYRLALSATPERWFDDEGTAALVQYFGPVVYELGLGDAIAIGALCPYRYVPRIVELSADETGLYMELTRKIGAMLGDESAAEDDSALGHLLRRRGSVLAHAAGKLPLLRQDVASRRDEWYQLIYCAEGRRPGDEGAPPGPSQLNDAVGLLGNELGLTVHPYHSETPRSTRRALLRRFGSGDDLRCLVAMRCLDEGVDIPDARVAYLLASSRNPRQFIQRRGRVLRRAEGKELATIVDYVVVPAAGTPVDLGVERRLMIRELERTVEFARLSLNYAETLTALRPLKTRFGLMDL